MPQQSSEMLLSLCCSRQPHLPVCPVHIPLMGDKITLSGEKFGQCLARDHRAPSRGLQETTRSLLLYAKVLGTANQWSVNMAPT